MELAFQRETKAPPKLDSSVQTARTFYRANGGLPLYDNHGKHVLARAREVGVVEPNVIAEPEKDLRRAWINSDIANIILYHVVDYAKLVASGVPLPPPLMDPALLRENRIFCELTHLDRTGADSSLYVPLLNNGSPPLALLARIVDYAVTHRMEDRLEGLVCKNGSGIFRMYSSRSEAAEAMKMEAKAGEHKYAPVAELLGFPTLAGDIFRHAYSVNHRSIYDHVVAAINSDLVLTRLQFTQSLVMDLRDRIETALAKLGFAATMTPRPIKHEGKIMKKIRLRLSEEYVNSQASSKMALEDYLHLRVHTFDLTRLNDLVALRVILNSFKGRDVDAMPPAKQEHVIARALAAVQKVIRKELARRLPGSVPVHEFKNKENGYKAHHIDVALPPGDLRAARFEVQVKTSGWHTVAEGGDATHSAAHYLYVGGDADLIRPIAQSYKDLIHLNGNGKH